jgi:hypothetical protein
VPSNTQLRRFCLAVCGGAGALFAQSAELSGFVRDQSESSIPGARLELRSLERGTRFRTSTNQDGVYCFPGLKPGIYDATVQANGFRTLTRDAILLNVGDRSGLDFSLQLSGVTGSITVSAESPTGGGAPSSQDGAVGTVVDQRFVANMPLNGRSFQSLIELTPGVVRTPSGGETPGQFSVNGQRNSANYVMIDGVSADFGASPTRSYAQSVAGALPALNILGGTNSLVSVDAMQEFRILSSSFAPEYGRTPGAQISILTRSGTNDFHGTAFDYLRNEVFDARNWFNVVPEPKPPLRQNDFGGTFGGPIRKNRTFFFGSYEGLRLRQPNFETGTFLTAEARAKVAPVFQPIVNALPLPTGPVNPDGITAPLTVSFSDPSAFDATSVRIDHVTSRVTLFGRYNHAPSSQGSRIFSQTETDSANLDTATGGATILISPHKVNEVRVNWSRAVTKAEWTTQNLFGAVAPPASALFPSFSGPETGLAKIVIASGYPPVQIGTLFENTQRQINLIDTFSMTAGVHLPKFGVDYRRMQPTNAPASYNYAVSASYESLLAGKVDYVAVSGNDPITVRMHNYSLFAQDTWKVSPRLTLTYGVRWEINTPPASVTSGKPLYTGTGFFDPGPVGLAPVPLWQTQGGNFAPRVGAAWMITRNTVVRGGFGLFYDLGYGARIPLAYSFPYVRSDFTVYNPAIPFDLNSPALQPLPSSTVLPLNRYALAVDPHLRLPRTYQWNVAWERRFGARQSVTATYVGAWGMDLIRRDYVLPEGSIFALRSNLPQVTYNSGHSHYNALQLLFLRRLSGGLQALVSYTLSDSTDTISTDNGDSNYDSAGTTAILASSMNELKAQLPPAAPSDFDLRHLFSAAMSWELPAPRKFARGLLRGWTLDGIVRAQSAPPLNVMFARSILTTTVLVQADVVPGQPFWLADANEPRGRVLNPGAFAAPAGLNGNFPRNSLRGFGFSQTDAALRRQFHLTERVRLEVRAEYFNVFNHPNFDSPSSLWGLTSYTEPLPAFGKVYPGNTLNVALGGGGQSAGQAAIYAPGGPRSAQFTVRLSF